MNTCHPTVRINYIGVSFARPRVTSILKEQGNMKKLAVRIPRLKVLLYAGFVERSIKKKGGGKDT